MHDKYTSVVRVPGFYLAIPLHYTVLLEKVWVVSTFSMKFEIREADWTWTVLSGIHVDTDSTVQKWRTFFRSRPHVIVCSSSFTGAHIYLCYQETEIQTETYCQNELTALTLPLFSLPVAQTRDYFNLLRKWSVDEYLVMSAKWTEFR